MSTTIITEADIARARQAARGWERMRVLLVTFCERAKCAGCGGLVWRGRDIAGLAIQFEHDIPDVGMDHSLNCPARVRPAESEHERARRLR